eukprot:3408637-Lingulodinium_polyedra.AAC.1
MRVPKGAQVGAAILVQCVEESTAAWPSDMPHWTPPPAVVEGVDPNAEWVAHRCSMCKEVKRSLIVTRDIPAGERVFASPGTEGDLIGPGTEAN